MKQVEQDGNKNVVPVGWPVPYGVLESLGQIKHEPAWLEGKDRTVEESAILITLAVDAAR